MIKIRSKKIYSFLLKMIEDSKLIKRELKKIE